MTPTVPIETNLDSVVAALALDRTTGIIVLDDRHRVAGVVEASDVIRTYRGALEEALRRLGSSFPGAGLLEEEIRAGADADGRSVSDAAWPAGTVVLAIQRGEQLIFPEPQTRLRVGDVVSILAPAGQIDRLVLATTGQAAEPAPGSDGDALI
jgi:K+/H+ antiporter YhaU regulatory subunit KhtT